MGAIESSWLLLYQQRRPQEACHQCDWALRLMVECFLALWG